MVNLLGLTQSAYLPVALWVELAGGGRNNGISNLYHYTGDKGYSN